MMIDKDEARPGCFCAHQAYNMSQDSPDPLPSKTSNKSVPVSAVSDTNPTAPVDFYTMASSQDSKVEQYPNRSRPVTVEDEVPRLSRIALILLHRLT